MITDALLAYLHHIAAFALVAIVFVEMALRKSGDQEHTREHAVEQVVSCELACLCCCHAGFAQRHFDKNDGHQRERRDVVQVSEQGVEDHGGLGGR